MRLALVIPTYNEIGNVRPLLSRLEVTLRDISHEIVFVDDDSPDGTAALIRGIAQTGLTVRVIQRIGRRGLSSACIEGMLSCSADFIAVMDADLQHDEGILPAMLAEMMERDLDLVVGSRHMDGGSMAAGMNRRRRLLSETGKHISRKIHRGRLSDPMSGFFMVKRTFFDGICHQLSGIGFKILLDIFLSSSHDVRVGEVPYHFRERQHGASKLDILVGLQYLELLMDKAIGSYVSVRFALFSLVGACGAGLHLLLLYSLLSSNRISFAHAQLVTAALVMTMNYTLNNSISYRDRRRKGFRYWTGLLYFCFACSFGVLANVAIATSAYRHGIVWPLAAMIGLVFGSVWNYGATSVTTWRDGRQRSEQTAARQKLAIVSLLERGYSS